MQLQRNEVLTGILVVATLAVLTGILALLGAPGLFRPLTTYKIYFDNAAGIKLGAPVLLAGRKIGQVAKLFSPFQRRKVNARWTSQNLCGRPRQTPLPHPRSHRAMKFGSMCKWIAVPCFIAIPRRA